MSLKNAPAFYEDRHGELQPTEATGRLFRMLDAQRKELTATMLVFENPGHSIKITDESKGAITATVRDMATAEMLYTVQFAKKNKQGAIYTFRDAARLSYLAFEPSKIVIDHRAVKAQKVAERMALVNGTDVTVAVPTASTPTALDAVFTPAELADDGQGSTAAPARPVATSTPVAVDPHAEAAALRAVVNETPAVSVPPSATSASRRTPIGQRHAPWRQR